jgi:multidrug resistance efflux pump
LDNRDQTIALEQAEAALGTAKSNLNTAQELLLPTKASILLMLRLLRQMHK